MKVMMEQILESRGISSKRERELCLRLYLQAKESKDRYASAFALTYLADAYQTMGRPFRALNICQKAMLLVEENGYESLLLVLQNLLGIVYVDLDDEQGAMDCFLSGVHLAKKRGDQKMLATYLANIAYLYQRVEEYDKAKCVFEKSYQAFSEVSDKNGVLIDESFYRLQTASVLARQGKIDRAIACLNVIEKGEGSYYSVDYWMVYADCYAKKQMRQETLTCLEKAWKQLEQSEENFGFLECYCNMIEVLLQIEEYEKGKVLLKRANKLLDKMNLVGKRVKVSEYEIQLYKAIGDTKNLKKSYQHFFEWDQAFEKERRTAEQKRVQKRIELQEEKERHADMEVRQSVLETKNELDELTQILNRRGLKHSMNALLEEARFKEQTLAVIMIDVDFFKEFNDEYGHVEGDTCLKNIAQLLKQAAGEQGVAGRYGGDEFLVVLLNQDTLAVAQTIRTVQQSLEKLQMRNKRSKVSDFVTITVGGVNRIPNRQDCVRNYVDAADQALYRIKKKTRNGFEVTELLEPLEGREANE